MWWLLRAIGSTAFLLTIIFTIPLAFDVGGRSCGLAFSLALSSFYFFYSILRLSIPSSSRPLRLLLAAVNAIQVIVIPVLLFWCLSRFSVDSDLEQGWIKRSIDVQPTWWQMVKSWFTERDSLPTTLALGSWDRLLRWSTPVFQLTEGFCSLLVIQAIGQVTKYLVNHEGGDSWMIALLVASASVISSSVYFLWRITTFPDLDSVDAILLGCVITCAFFLCVWGIGSGRGNPPESSLLFAYMTLCIYQIFTDYQSATKLAVPPPPTEPSFPPLPPILMASYSTLMHVLSTLPSTIHSIFNFLIAAVMTITPSVIVSLAYRVFALYAAARIIPAVRDSGARALSQDPSLDDNDGVGQIVAFLSYFSPSILIAVYTSLLMQHFSTTSTDQPGEWWTSQGGDAGSNVWRWLNLAATMALYAVELYLGREHDEDALTRHWKVD